MWTVKRMVLRMGRRGMIKWVDVVGVKCNIVGEE